MTAQSDLNVGDVRRFIAKRPLALSTHAKERAIEMSTGDLAEFGALIRDAYADPTDIGYSNKHDAWHLTRGDITLCIRFDDGAAILATILWSSQEGWIADLARGGATDRTVRAAPIRLVPSL